MKVEVRCLSCGRRFLVEEADRSIAPCPVCGVTMAPGADPEPPTPPERTGEKDGSPEPTPKVKIIRPGAEGPETVGPAREPTLKAAPRTAGAEIVCPRCGLHFIPRDDEVPKTSERRRTVLVVEDMEYFREIAREALEPQYEVKQARTVAEARGILGAGGVDLLLLDLTLEDEDGTVLLRELPFKPCPILVFTAEDESEMYGESWTELQALGADDVVLKGMNVGESILRKVRSLLGDSESDESPGG